MTVCIVSLLIILAFGSALFAEDISKADKYNLLKKDPTWPMISSGLIGFGSGQFMAGDTNKGILFAAADGLVMAGILYYSPQKIGWQLAWTALLTGVRLWEITDVYQNIENQNNNLRKKLKIEE